MKRLLLFALAVFAGAFLCAGETKPGVEQLGWLAGTWRFERGEREVTEMWMPPSGGTMLGMSRTVAKGRTAEYEFVVIRPDDAGDLLYVAKPSGQAEAAFRLVRMTEREVVFENPAHDFPQRISYTRAEDSGLLAAIEGTRNGKTRRVEFPYRRLP